MIHAARQDVPRGTALAVERERDVDLFDDANQREGGTHSSRSARRVGMGKALGMTWLIAGAVTIALP
jgi:hypothetical protein